MGVVPLRHGLGKFADFLRQLVQRLIGVVPVKAHIGSLFLYFGSSHEGGEALGNSLHGGGVAFHVLFFLLELFPVTEYLFRRVSLCCAEYVGMAVYHLIDYAGGHIPEGEGRPFLLYDSVHSDMKQ